MRKTTAIEYSKATFQPPEVLVEKWQTTTANQQG
jgi:hypothetical protein